jgi:hypothetical protein
VIRAVVIKKGSVEKSQLSEVEEVYLKKVVSVLVES